MLGQTLERVALASPFLVRTFDPPLAALGRPSRAALRRLGKRIVLAFDDDLFLVLHLMIAGPLPVEGRAARQVPGKVGLAAFDFPSGTLLLTEAGSKKRASLHVVRGEAAAWRDHDPGGLEVLDADVDGVRGAPAAREPHAQARADRSRTSSAASATPTRTRSSTRRGCRRCKLTAHADRRRGQRAVRRDATRCCASGPTRLRAESRRAVSREGDGVPRRAWRCTAATASHARVCGAPVQRIRLRRQRGELLRAVPDRRAPARRPRAVAPAARGLAAHARGARKELKQR